jgi:hypothetical protein
MNSNTDKVFSEETERQAVSKLAAKLKELTVRKTNKIDFIVISLIMDTCPENGLASVPSTKRSLATVRAGIFHILNGGDDVTSVVPHIPTER